MQMSIVEMFTSMTPFGWAIVIILALLSIYSISVMIDRFRAYRLARRQSQEFLPALVRALKTNNLQEAVNLAKKYNRSHVARVVHAGIQEYILQEGDTATSYDRVDAVQRQLESEAAITSADMKKGLAGLATIGATAPFIGLFGTVLGIIWSFQGMAASGSGGIASVSAGIAEALVATAVGLLVAIPAVMSYNYFTNIHERFQIEMTNSASDVMAFFLKKQGVSRGAA
jgi:biopolymer transport protein ExbB/biopolymer transport protein TolQ